MNDNLSNDLEEQEPELTNPADTIPADDDLPEAVVPFDPDVDEESASVDLFDAPDSLDFTFSASGLDELDIEGALASITGLDAAIAEHAIPDEETLSVEPEPAVDPEQVRRETELRRKAVQKTTAQIEQPAFGRLGRGQLASLIPAVLLMILGAGLTVYFAEPSVFDGVVLNGGLLAQVLAGMFSLMLISYWLSSGRWASGALMIALSMVSSLGVMVFAPEDAFPLLLSGIGVSVLISTLLSRGINKNQYFVGVALVVAGLVGYGFNLNAHQFDITRLQPVLLGVIGVFCALLLIAPLFAKKQR